MPLCQARHCDKWLYFPGEKKARFYRPYRCGEEAENGSRLCAGCTGITGKTQLSRGFNHGLVGDLIPPSSHAYGGPWYLAQVAKYGEPSKEVLEEANEYLEESFDITAGPEIAALFRAGMHSKVDMPSRATALQQVQTRLPNAVVAATTKKPVNKTKKISGGGAAPQYIKESSNQAAAKIAEYAVDLMPRVIESLTEPLDVCSVEWIDVEPFKFDGEKYYRNIDTNELYARIANKGMGCLIGTLNEKAQAILRVE